MVSGWKPRVEFVPEQFATIDAFLEDRIYEFNANATGFVDAESYAAAVRDIDGRIIAAVSGFAWGRCCFIDKLWVDQSARLQGLGSSLVRAVEEHARARRCAQVILSSHTFQAPGFYSRLGYVEQARIADYPAGHSDIHFTKRLDIRYATTPGDSLAKSDAHT